MSDQVPAERHFEILNDGTTIAVLVGGKEEFVKVRKIGIKDIPLYAGLLGQELKEIAFLCSKPEEWVEQLDPDSFTALIEEGRRLNFRHASSSLRRGLQLMEAMGGNKNVQLAIEKAVAKAGLDLKVLSSQ